jgi:hypothetical protein
MTTHPNGPVAAAFRDAELTPDSALILPFGWSGHWNITQTVRRTPLRTFDVFSTRP